MLLYEFLRHGKAQVAVVQPCSSTRVRWHLLSARRLLLGVRLVKSTSVGNQLSFFLASWSSIPIQSPDHFEDGDSDFYSYASVLFGSQSHLQRLVLSISDYITVVSSRQCFFCPGVNLFDSSESTSYQVRNHGLFSTYLTLTTPPPFSLQMVRD